MVQHRELSPGIRRKGVAVLRGAVLTLAGGPAYGQLSLLLHERGESA